MYVACFKVRHSELLFKRLRVYISAVLDESRYISPLVARNTNKIF